MLRIDDKIDIEVRGDLEIFEKLPVGFYKIEYDFTKDKTTLLKVKNPELPEKFYGDIKELTTRYLKTFKHKDGNLGVLLAGEKGTGKSLLAINIAVEVNLPVIIVDKNIPQINIPSFLSKIDQPCVIFLDEFDKVFYDSVEKDSYLQDSFLTLMDGVNSGKKLFLITCNNIKNIGDYFKNRPGRIHYYKEYRGLEDSVIDSIIENNLENKDYSEELKEELKKLGKVTMDILLSLIFEVNLYKESPKKTIGYLNIRPFDMSYSFEIVFKGDKKIGYRPKEFDENKVYKGIILEHPLALLENNELELEVFDKDNHRHYFKVPLGDSKYEQEGDLINIIMNNGTIIKFKPLDKVSLLF